MFKGRAINKYFRKMNVYLKGRYGRSKYYSKEQVLAIIRDFGFRKRYTVYALAIYVEKGQFELLADEYPETEIKVARQKIADMFFDGNTDYTCDHRLKMQRSYEIKDFVNSPSSFAGGDSGGGDSGCGGGGE